MSAIKLIFFLSLSLICLLASSCNSVPEHTVSSEILTDKSKTIVNTEKKQSITELADDSQNAADISEPGKISQSNPNTSTNPHQFNRLLKKRRNGGNDSIYDVNNPAKALLQNPQDAFADLPKAKAGNSVDWVNAIAEGKIKPRSDLYDPEVAPLVMDLNIIREVKGSMPDVVFPHKQHTELLDCTNCHPAIFIPQKGANDMSMAKNLMGEMCGVCHGKVAFPLSRCTSCHSKKKPPKEIKQTNWKW